jgi:hypothetical protein
MCSPAVTFSHPAQRGGARFGFQVLLLHREEGGFGAAGGFDPVLHRREGDDVAAAVGGGEAIPLDDVVARVALGEQQTEEREQGGEADAGRAGEFVGGGLSEELRDAGDLVSLT